MKPPAIVNATQAELDELLAKAKPTFSCEHYLLLERVFGTFVDSVNQDGRVNDNHLGCAGRPARSKWCKSTAMKV